VLLPLIPLLDYFQPKALPNIVSLSMTSSLTALFFSIMENIVTSQERYLVDVDRT